MTVAKAQRPLGGTNEQGLRTLILGKQGLKIQQRGCKPVSSHDQPVVDEPKRKPAGIGSRLTFSRTGKAWLRAVKGGNYASVPDHSLKQIIYSTFC